MLLYQTIQSVIDSFPLMAQGKWTAGLNILVLVFLFTIARPMIVFLFGFELLFASPWIACHTDMLRSPTLTYACSNKDYWTYLRTNFHLDIWYMPYAYVIWALICIWIIWDYRTRLTRKRSNTVYYSNINSL